MVNESTVVISTVWENIAGFTKREIDQAKLPRQLQVRLEYPSVADILNSIKSGRILHAPLSKNDFENTFRIRGKDLGFLKGRTIRSRSERVIIEPTNVSVDKHVVCCAQTYSSLEE